MTTIITLLLINVIWVGYALTEGIREGFYWHYENNSRRVCDFDINPVFNIQRLFVLLITMGLMFYMIGWLSILTSACLVSTFSFFHNGTYYHTRHKLDGRSYPKKWMDESKTFPPFTMLTTYKKRTISMILGFLTQAFIYLFML